MPTGARVTELQITARLGDRGDRVALVAGARRLTFAALAARVEEVAERLGSTRRLVLVPARNDVSSIVGYLGALRGGHAVILADADGPHLGGLTGSYDPDVVLRPQPDDVLVVERRPGTCHDLHPDLSLLLSTSGTTGSAKLVRLSQRNLDANADAIGSALGITADDRAATSLPMHYCYGLSVINSHLLAGASLVVTDRSVVDPEFWDELREARATTFAGVPYTFDLLDQIGVEHLALPDLRYVTQAGGRLPAEQVRRYAALGQRSGWDLVVMYGQTEATARMAVLPPAAAIDHPHSIGRAVPGGSLRLDPVDGAGTGVGELVYAGPNVMLGYAHGPADLKLGATLDELRTGDLARVSDDGLYEIVGRVARFVKVFGLRVDLDEIESAVRRSGTAALCAGDDDGVVVAVEQAADEDLVRSVVTAATGLPPARIQVEPMAELPRGATGKPDYGAVLRRARTPRHPVGRAGPGTASVRSLYAELLQVPRVDDDDSFVSLGGDSLSYVEVSLRLEELLGHLPPAWHSTPVGELEGEGSRARRLRWVESNVLLRAVAITLVVGNHLHVIELPGGAHLLLAVAGFNFARFALRSGRFARSILRIAVPSAAWIGGAALLSDEFGLGHALLLNAQLNPPGARWAYWFVEALVQILVPLALVLAVPAARRAAEQRPLVVAWAVLVIGLCLRSDVTGVGDAHHRIYRPNEVLWLFAAGWVAAAATNARQRAALCVVLAVAVPSFFDQGMREALVLAGAFLLVWVPRLPVTRVAARLVGRLAATSLYVYLSHWQVFPALRDHLSAEVTWVVTLVIGALIGTQAQRLADALERRVRDERAAPAPARGGLPATGPAGPRRRPPGPTPPRLRRPASPASRRAGRVPLPRAASSPAASSRG